MLTWCKDYEIGVEQIDQEHKDLIDHFEKLYTLMREGHGHEYFKELVYFLENYVQVHLEHEESFQREIAYVNLEAHTKLHDFFREKVERVKQLHPDYKISNEELIKLNLFIKDWLSHHILVEDKKIGDFVLKKKETNEM